MNLDLLTTDDLAREINRRHRMECEKAQAYAQTMGRPWPSTTKDLADLGASLDIDMTGILRGDSARPGWTVTRTTPPHDAQQPPLRGFGGHMGTDDSQTWAGLGDGWGIDDQQAPDLMTPAADPSASINVTLKERQREYGDFNDVARTASEIRDIVLGQRAQWMGAVQREAIVMIASKLARIANGNPNNVDSWRDIAGYATLVVRELEA